METIGTYLRLPKSTIRRMKALAAAQEKSLAQLVRDAIEKTYDIDASLEPVAAAGDPFTCLIGSARSGRKDGSAKHDDVIYGR